MSASYIPTGVVLLPSWYPKAMHPAHTNEPAATESPRRRSRKLRIAWSAAWGFACVLLCVLWARSFYYSEHFDYGDGHAVSGVWSFRGGLYFGRSLDENGSEQGFAHWNSEIEPDNSNSLGDASFGFDSYVNNDGFRVVIAPYWSLGLLGATAVALPWVRFSLRTLLIATTLFAVGLGLITYLLRK